jgi:hypothetical protein
MGDGVRHAADLQVGQAKVVLDYRVGRLQSRRFAPGEGRDPLLQWAPAFAGVAGLGMSDGASLPDES